MNMTETDPAVCPDRADVAPEIASADNALTEAQPPAHPPKMREPLNLEQYIADQRLWSGETFGPGARTAGLLAHIGKELEEIAGNPGEVSEWVDVIILAIDGAWRAGHEPTEIAAALVDKQRKNFARSWPDWRTSGQDEPIEHLKKASADNALPHPQPPEHPSEVLFKVKVTDASYDGLWVLIEAVGEAHGEFWKVSAWVPANLIEEPQR